MRRWLRHKSQQAIFTVINGRYLGNSSLDVCGLPMVSIILAAFPDRLSIHFRFRHRDDTPVLIIASVNLQIDVETLISRSNIYPGHLLNAAFFK